MPARPLEGCGRAATERRHYSAIFKRKILSNFWRESGKQKDSIAHLSGIKPNIQEKSCDVDGLTTGVQLSLGFG
jgi:hypothetical protein